MIPTIDADDAWWPPTFTSPDGRSLSRGRHPPRQPQHPPLDLLQRVEVEADVVCRLRVREDRHRGV
jgi:hypothetical protein